MAEDLYNKKLESLQQFIPFLDNMILQLKDPSKKNREQQLNKMMSLHAMITDKRKKLKLETLTKCEDVISKLYEKVHNKPIIIKKGFDDISLTPASPSPTRDLLIPPPLTIPTERIEESRIPKIDIYSSAAESLIRSKLHPDMSLAAKVPDMSKPPISLEDLKTLEEDVQEKINENSLNQASLQELTSLREKLAEEIFREDVLLKSPQKQKKDEIESINTTVRNALSLTKKMLLPPEKPKSKEKESSMLSPKKTGEIGSSVSSPKKEHKSSQPSNKSPKILKEPDSIFGNILSHIDDQLLGGKKKKEERRNSLTGKDDKKSCEKDVKKKDRKLSISKDDSNDEKKDNNDIKKKERSTISTDEMIKTKDEKKSKDKELDIKKKEQRLQTGEKNKLKDEKESEQKDGNTKDDKNTPSIKENSKDASLQPTGKKSVEVEEEQLRTVLEKLDKTDVPNQQQEVEQSKNYADKNTVGKISVKNDLALLKSTIDQSKEEESARQTTFKRLADKYHPKPRKHAVEPDVDKEVSDIIEEEMKTSPPKIPLINQMPAPIPPPPSLLLCSQMEPEPVPNLPPAVLQNILAPGTTELINNVVNQLRQNTAGIEAIKIPAPQMPPAENFIEDNFVSEYAREDFAKDNFSPIQDYTNFQSQAPTMRRETLNFEPPPPLLNNQFNHMNHLNQRFMPIVGDGFNDNFTPNRPFTPMPQGFTQPNLNIQSTSYDMQSLDYYPPNAPIPSNQYNCGPPLLSPEIPQFHNEQKPANFGMMPNHDQFRHNEDMRWRQEEGRDPFSWDRRDQDFRLSRDPRTYREYREMRDSRDPRVAIRDPRENRDPRDNPRDPRAIRDPRVNRDLRENRDPREPRDLRENRDSRDRDPRLNKAIDQRDFDRDRSRFRDTRQSQDGRPSRYDTRFDMMYSRTNRNRSRSRSRAKSYSKDTFMSPLDSLYSGKEDQRTGKGYGVQNFRIPKIKNKDEKDQSGKVSSTNEEADTSDVPHVINDDSNESTNNEVTGNDIQTEETKDQQTEDSAQGKDIKEQEQEEKTNETDVEVEKKDLEPPKLLDETEETKVVENTKPIPVTQSVAQEEAKPADQTILAQFFANLLGSKNKKDKKTALYSLISTFSDSFSEKELSKITKIIKADDEAEDSEEEEEEVKKLQKKPETELTKEPEKEIDAEETDPDSPVKATKRKFRRIRRISSTTLPKDEITKEEEIIKTDESPEISKTEEQNVVVSVGERIKSRKRISVTPPKPKKKCKTELDMLHDDIQDMFIRDGVLTATGKRMCRLLKDDPNALTTPQPSSSVEPPKVRKKPGPKPKKRSNSSEMKAMKNMRVLIPKIPDSSIETPDESPRRSLRSTTKTVYAESDEEESSAPVDEDSALGEGSFRDESDVESTDTEKSRSLSADNTNKAKVTRRKRGKGWASGNIPSNKRRKKKQSSVDEPTEENETKDTSTTQPEMDKPFIEPDKNYYIDFATNKSHECKLCNYQGRFITTHYKIQHSDSEVLTSRFSPAVAQEAIEDSKKNLAKYEEIMKISGSGKYHFTCRFCAFNTTVPPTIFYDHITTHTGEYRHVCPMCDFSASSGKTLKSHMFTVHNNGDKRVARKSYSQTVIFAYMCGECNYVQLNQKNVEDHINIFHLQKPTIFKVNMSTTTDAQVFQLAESTSVADEETKADEEPPIAIKEKVEQEDQAMLPPQPKKRMKAAPKCVKDKIKAQQALAERGEDTCDTGNFASNSNTSSELEKLDIPEKSSKKVGPISKRRLTRELSMSSDEDLIITGRSRRAAKDKATEKLKSLMEASEGGSRKKSLSSSTDEEKTKKEETKMEIDQTNTKHKRQEDDRSTKLEEKPVLEKKQDIPRVKKEVEMNVFTCETDIQEENKKIEQERLQLMDELNKSVGSRTSLNFVDKLCNRLNQHDIIVKQEPRDDLTDSQFPTNALDASPIMPVLEKNLPTHFNEPISTKPLLIPAASKKPVLQTEDMQLSKSKYDVTQKNDKLITDMIQKLKGKLATNPDDKIDKFIMTQDTDYDSEGPPPLTHVNELRNVKPADGSTKTLLIGGLVKVIKYPSHLLFSCLVPPCVFSSENREAFQKHCSEAHKQQERSTLCEMCGMEIVADTECTLLENIFKHAIQEHEDFMRSDSEEDTKSPSKLRIRKLSGDALSVKQDWEQEIDGSNNGSVENDDGNAPLISEVAVSEAKALEEAPTSVAELEMSDENPFPFKIAGVMSLAEPVPPLTPISKAPLQMAATPQLVVKEAKMSAAELKKPRKTPRAMAKFIASVSDLYKCPHYYCLFSTNFRYFIERHLKAHKVDEQTLIPCVYCDIKTPWEHMPMHIDIRHAHCRFACSYCLYRAVLKEYVFLHQDQVHPDNDYSVIALPLAKTAKKWAVNEAKIDPKSLCQPYRCTDSCGMDFLFENEFRKHLQDDHKEYVMQCGFKNCWYREQPRKMANHWTLYHNVGVYQCGCCKLSSNEMKNMYKHFAICHQGQQPEILIRIQTQLQEDDDLGYTPEAFAVMRKVVSVPSNISGQSKSNKYEIDPVPLRVQTNNTANYTVPKKTTTLQVVTTLPQNIPKSVLLPSNKSVISRALTVVSTNSATPSGGNILILPNVTSVNTLSGIVMSPNSNTQVTSVASTGKTLKLVASGLAAGTVIPSLSEITISQSQKNKAVREDARKDTEEPDLTIEPLEHVTVTEDNSQVTEENDTCEEADPLSLDADTDLLDAAKSAADSSGDESEGKKLDKAKNEAKSGLMSYQLYRCAFCDFSFSNSTDFKRHVSYSAVCRMEQQVPKPYACVHCGKQTKNAQMLVDHIHCHGVERFTCSLCGSKFTTIAQTRNHIKNRHSITQTLCTPLNSTKNNIDTDEYLVRPKQMGAPKEAAPPEPAASDPTLDNVYTPETADKIPMRHILSSVVKCGLCSYTTKVRTNMVRHLQFHSEEKAVSDTAPVNPVPCLEKNEKMFDKMVNLASSSHTGTRMGGTKSDTKEEKVNFPEYIPSHCRYVCCAHGCSYICPEESNLRHHLIALHDGETSFTCVHCKQNLTPTDADSLIKHFKLHGLQLYKCHYCSFAHNLRHKIERHVTDVHQDLPVKTVVVRFMESEPKDNNQEASTSSTQSAPAPAPTTKYYKPWRCCMCKYKSNTQSNIQTHVLEKHEIDSQFKCALCTYKSDDKETFPEHFKTTHDNQTIDIIYAYRKMEDDKEKEPEAFDTTPLWQRDRPRVRHIRGILFDESSPTPVKSPKKAKSAAAASPVGPSAAKPAAPSPGPSGAKVAAPSPGPSGSKTVAPSPTPAPAAATAASDAKSSAIKRETRLDQSIESVVNGTADILKQSSSGVSDDIFQTLNKLIKDSEVGKNKENVVIVIDDDDEPKTPAAKDKDNKNAPVAKNRAMKRKGAEVPAVSKIPKTSEEVIDLESSGSDSEQDEFGEKFLKVCYGPFGSPVWKQFRCPVCKMFKSKRIPDFVFHLFKEMKAFRFKCKVCSDESITYRYMHKHVKEHHPQHNSKANITPCPSNEKLLTWIQMVIREQSLIIMANNPKTRPSAASGDNVVLCDFCTEKFNNEHEKNEHSISHWTAKPYCCSSCTYTSYLDKDVRKHFKSSHKNELLTAKESDMVLCKGPTVDKVLKISDSEHMKDTHGKKTALEDPSVSVPPVSSPTEAMEIQDPLGDVPAENQTTSDAAAAASPLLCNEVLEEKADGPGLSDNDLIIITKMDRNVPTENDVFCCEYCPFMASSEVHVVSHITAEHDNMSINFRMINREACDQPDEHVGCMLCPEIGSEMKIRQHHMEKHEGRTLSLYRFQCAICGPPKRFLKFVGLKAHFGRVHPGSQLQYSTLYDTGKTTKVTGLKTYKCPVCPYVRNLKSNAVSYVRQHLKQHFKAFLCGICQSTKYKTRAEVIAHFMKKHPGAENQHVMQDTQILDNYNSTMAKIIAAATDYLEDRPAKLTARKSTGAAHSSGAQPEYSFYGTKPEPVDMGKIMTTVDLNGMQLTMTADKLSKIFDLNASVALEDCNLSVNLSNVFDS